MSDETEADVKNKHLQENVIGLEKDLGTMVLKRRRLMCRADSCSRTIFRRGYCWRHFKEHGAPAEVSAMERYNMCRADSCSRIRAFRGYCRRHFKEHGAPAEVSAMVARA